MRDIKSALEAASWVGEEILRRIENGFVEPFPADRRFREHLRGSDLNGASAAVLSWPTKRKTVGS
jgi:hypothetical protein